jgi:hypothetical protein
MQSSVSAGVQSSSPCPPLVQLGAVNVLNYYSQHEIWQHNPIKALQSPPVNPTLLYPCCAFCSRIYSVQTCLINKVGQVVVQVGALLTFFGLVSRPWPFVYGQQYTQIYYAYPPSRVRYFHELE